MITLFTTAKPFIGHSAIIQRNALQSWTLLHPEVEVILFGDDEGAAQICSELNIRHEPHAERNDFGYKRIDYLFDRAQEIARNPLLCYINCDIILTSDFVLAFTRTQSLANRFLMVGHRWDTNIDAPIDFSDTHWASKVRSQALAENRCSSDFYIDYFAFTKNLYYKAIPPFVIGRVYWDNWLVWAAKNRGGQVIDASAEVLAIHQNHDYGYHPKGKQGVWTDEHSLRNFSFAGGYRNLRNIGDADALLVENGLKKNRKRDRLAFRRNLGLAAYWILNNVIQPVWFLLLRLTRPVRHVFGLRRKA